jgi:hypothetical protein
VASFSMSAKRIRRAGARRFDRRYVGKDSFSRLAMRTFGEASKRIAWRSDSKRVAGVEFIGLSEEAGKKIQTWIS